MELKGEKWKNYSTPYIDKYWKDEVTIRYGLNKLQTNSLIELRNLIDLIMLSKISLGVCRLSVY